MNYQKFYWIGVMDMKKYVTILSVFVGLLFLVGIIAGMNGGDQRANLAGQAVFVSEQVIGGDEQEAYPINYEEIDTGHESSKKIKLTIMGGDNDLIDPDVNINDPEGNIRIDQEIVLDSDDRYNAAQVALCPQYYAEYRSSPLSPQTGYRFPGGLNSDGTVSPCMKVKLTSNHLSFEKIKKDSTLLPPGQPRHKVYLVYLGSDAADVIGSRRTAYFAVFKEGHSLLVDTEQLSLFASASYDAQGEFTLRIDHFALDNSAYDYFHKIKGKVLDTNQRDSRIVLDVDANGKLDEYDFSKALGVIGGQTGIFVR